MFYLADNNSYAQTSQSVKSRVIEIKKWYNEVESKGYNDCKTLEYLEYQYDYAFDKKKPYVQILSHCKIENKYSVKKGEFTGHHYRIYITLYYRNNKIFFAFVEGGEESYSYENRFYCDANEKIILELHRDSDEYQPITSENKEVRDNIGKKLHTIIDITSFNRLN